MGGKREYQEAEHQREKQPSLKGCKRGARNGAEAGARKGQADCVQRVGVRCRPGWERGWASELPKIELPPLQVLNALPLPLPIFLGHTPHASVQTHLLELTPPQLNPHPCPRDSRNFSNVFSSKCWRKRSTVKREKPSL